MSGTTTEQAEVVWRPFPGSQRRFLTCPHWEVLYHGTRGPGKTDTLLMDFAQHVGQGYGADWRGILFRREYKELADVVHKSRRWFPRIWPQADFKESKMVWVWPTGEQLYFHHIKRPADYWRYHGHAYPWIGWEELTTWPDPELYDQLKSVNRSTARGMPRKYRSTTNPWGPGHNWVKMRFIDMAPPRKSWAVGRNLRACHIYGHWSENRALMEAEPDYADKIRSAASNPHQAEAWLDGRWDIVAGGMFDDVWQPTIHVLRPFPIPSSWRIDRSFDWGSSKPFSVGWHAESDGTALDDGRVFPRGTLVRIGEWYGWDGQTPNVGLRMTDKEIALGIVQREQELGIAGRCKPGPADAAIFALDAERRSIAQTFAANGVKFVASDKRPGSRTAGWQRLRNMLTAAAEKDLEAPHYYVFDTCRQFIRTVPALPRSDRDPDDVDTDTEDHVGDEVRYRITAPTRDTSTTPFHWT